MIRLATAFFALWAQSSLPPVTISPPPPLPANTIDLGLGRPTGTYSIRLPANVEAERCHLDLQQAGAFGGISGGVHPKIDRNTLTVPTGASGKPAQRLKAVVWCPGYAIAQVSEPALQKSTGETELALRPLANAEINAKVLLTSDGRSLAGSEVRVWYVALWVCGFFELSECFGPPSWVVTTATIGVDGALRFSVPNFAADPSVAARSFPGGFRLVTDDSFLLEADGAAAGALHAIPVLRSYPSNIVLRPRPH